jgi:hypothetical protein
MSQRKKQQTLRIASSALLAALATACGGGGGGGASPTPSAGADPAPDATATANPAVSATPTTVAPAAAPQLADCDMFPATAIFNTRIDDASRFPAHASSGAWIAMAGAGTPFTANWGGSSNPANTGNYWGLPINVVSSAGTQWPVVSLDGGYPAKSDCATLADGGGIVQGCATVPQGNRRFPFPSGTTFMEGNGDHHVLVVESGVCRLWEAYAAQNNGGQWSAQATATWDLRSNALRPDDWASADAAGLPITPLLAKAKEAATGEIRHALRVTFRDSALALQHVWPARFAAGGDNPGAIPFGSLLRLKASFVIPDNWSPQAKAVALAAKRYGMYVADNGVDFYVQGEPNDAWDPAVWQQLRTISLGDMEFVDLGAVTRDARFSAQSMQASW